MSANETWKGATRLSGDVSQKMRSFSIIFRTFLFSYIGFFIVLVYASHDPHDMKMSAVWLKAKYITLSQLGHDKTVNYRDDGGKLRAFSADQVARQSDVLSGRDAFNYTLVFSLVIALLMASVLTYLIRHYLVGYYGKRDRQKQLIRGTELVEERALIALLNKPGIASDIRIGNLPIRAGTEVQHFFISGASGTGKGNSIKDILDVVRARKQRFVVYDKSGEYVSKYYRKDRDIILNPFDERMPLWTPWHEVDNYYDCEHIAASFIPRERGEKQHWVDAPRTVFADLLWELRRRDQPSVQSLVDAIFDKKQLSNLLSGTASESVLDPDAPEQAGSVRSILTPKVRSLRHLPMAEEWFSFRQWVRNEGDDRCVFITCNERQLSSAKPLITAWLDILISEILSLKEDRQRRVFAVIDELASLDPITSIKTGLFEGRKFGLSMILSVTSIEMLNELYGNKVARAMVSMCATKASFRCDEPDSADWLARLYGEEDISEVREGVTLSKRYDSTSIQDDRQRHQLVLPTEFINLPDMQAVVKLGGGFPVAKIKVPYTVRPTISEVFIERENGEPLRAQIDNQGQFEGDVAPSREVLL